MFWEAETAELEAELIRGLGDAGDVERALAGLRALLPYPQPTEAGLDLITCRFAGRAPHVSVRLDLEGADLAEARAALAAARGLSVVHWKAAAQAGEAAAAAQIQIRKGASRPGAAATGQASTLARCALPFAGTSPGPGPAPGPPRPELVSAEIEIWRSGENAGGRPTEISAEAWTGALLHELGHALGFQGHVRGQKSWLSLDQTHLRRFGRAILAGEKLDAPVLRGLYALESGTVLGRRALTRSTRAWRRRILAEVAKGPARLEARVGDRSAEWSWQLADGRTLVLRFPYWSDQLAGQGPVLGVPTAETRALLEAVATAAKAEP